MVEFEQAVRLETIERMVQGSGKEISGSAFPFLEEVKWKVIGISYSWKAAKSFDRIRLR